MTTPVEFLLARIAEDEATARLASGPWAAVADRVLAECEAKRRILDLLFVVENAELHGDAGTTLNSVLRSLALPYSNHSDYRQEWKQ